MKQAKQAMKQAKEQKQAMKGKRAMKIYHVKRVYNMTLKQQYKRIRETFANVRYISSDGKGTITVIAD